MAVKQGEASRLKISALDDLPGGLTFCDSLNVELWDGGFERLVKQQPGNGE